MQPCRSLARIVVLLIALAGAVVFGSAGHAQAQEQVTIDVGDFWFCDASYEEGTCETVISAGDTAVWDFSSSINSHTVTECDASCDLAAEPSPLFDSGTVASGGSYSYTFDDAGTFPYFCEIHPTLMFGRIVVQEAPEPATQTPSVVEPGDIIPPGSTPLGGAGLPTSGQGQGDGSSSASWLLIALLAGGGALLALIGATAYGRTQRR